MRRRPGWMALALGLLTNGWAEAGIMLRASETAGGVVIAGGGTLDLTGLTRPVRGADSAAIRPGDGGISSGPLAIVGQDAYLGITGPDSFGMGGETKASSGSGDAFGVGTREGRILVPAGYTSGTALSSTSTYSGATFSSLGLTPGSYVIALPHDTFTFQVGSAVGDVPGITRSFLLDLSLGLAGIGLAGVGLIGWRKSRRRAA